MLQGWAVPQSTGGRWWSLRLSAMLQCRTRTREQGSERPGKAVSCCSAGLGGRAVQAAVLQRGREWGKRAGKNGFLVLLQCRGVVQRRGRECRELRVMMQCRARKRESWAADPRAQVGFGEGARTVWMLSCSGTAALDIHSPLPFRAGGRQYLFRAGSKNLNVINLIFFNPLMTAFFELFFSSLRLRSLIRGGSHVIIWLQELGLKGKEKMGTADPSLGGRVAAIFHAFPLYCRFCSRNLFLLTFAFTHSCMSFFCVVI